ncbi:MAG TPA: prepilin-type N-terminal cleavage/methylation domain-containing protein [Rugosimonospora sp.]|nr:prepilin-type N-terminal cleavage/methylation domain-containing protein [Rugosimonospora sp.]
MWTLAGGRSRDSGETLIELLITIIIMAVAVPVIVGSVGVGIMMSDIHRKQATASAAVHAYAEQVEQWVANGNYDASGTPNYSPAKTGYTAPTGYTASAGTVTCWSTSSQSFGSCGTDTGLQQVTLTVSSSDNAASEQLQLVIRQP